MTERYNRASLLHWYTDAVDGARLVLGLPRMLYRPVSLTEAQSTLQRRLARRDADLLELLRRAIVGQPENPYTWLLATAGCELGDIERLVEREGVESALQTLFRRGIYLTVDEFKGRCPAVRGSARRQISPIQLRNRSPHQHLQAQTSGSRRGAATPVPVDLEYLRDRAVNEVLTRQGLANGSS